MLWSAWLVGNLCTWMGDVTAAWVMTTLSSSTMLVALVQSATTLPSFLLAIPGGALADQVDRRRWFLGTQVWMAGVMATLAVTAFTGTLSAPVLLALVFANGVGFAMRWPLFSALLPEAVPRVELPQALALHSVAVNVSRIVGPIAGGVLLAALGAGWVFTTGALLSLASAAITWRWSRQQAPTMRRRMRASRLPRSMLAGLRYGWHSVALRSAMLRGLLMFAVLSGVLGLLPLLAQGLSGGGVRTYTVLYAMLALGAVVAAISMPRVRLWATPQMVVNVGHAVQGLCSAALAVATQAWQGALTMFIMGLAWLAVANMVGVQAQLAVPNRMRARGMSLFLLAVMAGGTTGAALSGAMAERIGVRPALLVLAGVAVVLAVALRRRYLIGHRDDGAAR